MLLQQHYPAVQVTSAHCSAADIKKKLHTHVHLSSSTTQGNACSNRLASGQTRQDHPACTAHIA